MYFRKEFEKKIEERERTEDIERIQYRQYLDDKLDEEKEKLKHFYKDVSKFQVITII